MSQRLPADQEAVLAAVVALEVGRSFHGNEPAATGIRLVRLRRAASLARAG